MAFFDGSSGFPLAKLLTQLRHVVPAPLAWAAETQSAYSNTLRSPGRRRVTGAVEPETCQGARRVPNQLHVSYLSLSSNLSLHLSSEILNANHPASATPLMPSRDDTGSPHGLT